MTSKNFKYQLLGILPDKEWQITMQMTIITGFQQVNERTNQVEDLMKEKPSDVKQQLKETVLTPEQSLLRVMPGNIGEIKSCLLYTSPSPRD